MAVFQQTDSTGGKKGLSPVVIVVIVLAVLLCCCCAVVIIGLIATNGHPFRRLGALTNPNTYLPLYLTLQTWL